MKSDLYCKCKMNICHEPSQVLDQLNGKRYMILPAVLLYGPDYLTKAIAIDL